MVQIEKEDGTVAGNKSINDGSGGQLSRQRTMEQRRTLQPTINMSGKGKQWLATTRVRGQRLAMAAKRAAAGRGIAMA